MTETLDSEKWAKEIPLKSISGSGDNEQAYHQSNLMDISSLGEWQAQVWSHIFMQNSLLVVRQGQFGNLDYDKESCCKRQIGGSGFELQAHVLWPRLREAEHEKIARKS